MEIQVKAYLVHSLEDVESFQIKVTETNKQIIQKRMALEYMRIIKILKDMNEAGTIKSIFIPKNKKLQPQLDKLVTTKRMIKVNMQKIKDAFD